MNRGTPVAWVIAAIGEAARDVASAVAASGPLELAALGVKLGRYCDKARAPEVARAPPGGPSRRQAAHMQPAAEGQQYAKEIDCT